MYQCAGTHFLLVDREIIVYQFSGSMKCTNEQGADCVLVIREYTLYQCKQGTHCVIIRMEHTVY